MKKYEYKYVKTDGSISKGVQKSCEDDAAMLTGYGLSGWRVHSLVETYYLLEREISE